MVKIQDLKQIFMLEPKPDQLLALIGKEARLSIFSTGTRLFKTGEAVDTFYMVIMGQVALTVALHPEMKASIHDIEKLTPAY